MKLYDDPQHDFEMACWDFEISKMREALDRGAKVNNKSGRKVWEAALRKNATDTNAQLECFRFLLENGLTLDGGGKNSHFESMMKRIQTMPPAFSSALIEHFGAKTILKRIKNRAPNDFIDIELWGEAISAHEQSILNANTQKAGSSSAMRKRRL